MSSGAPESGYSVVLRHLSADLKSAGAALPEVKLPAVPAKRLKAMIEALATLAPKVSYPAMPELRITAPEGMFVVKATGGKLELVSWSTSRPAGGALTAAQIFGTITGEVVEDEAPATTKRTAKAGPSSNKSRNLVTMIGLIIAILGVNGFTVWFVTRPKKTLLPKYALLPPEPAERLLTSVAGVYETGPGPGDRQLKITKAGEAEWIKFGPERAVRDKKSFTVAAAKTGSSEALLTSRRAMIVIKDPITVVMYGDSYRRVTR